MGSNVTCPWCGEWTRLEPVEGRMVCTACHKPVYDEMHEKTDTPDNSPDPSDS